MLYLTSRSTCSPFRLISSKQRKDVLRCQSTELSFRIVGVSKYQAFNLGLQIQNQPRTMKNTPPHPVCQDIDDSIQGKVEIKRTNIHTRIRAHLEQGKVEIRTNIHTSNYAHLECSSHKKVSTSCMA